MKKLFVIIFIISGISIYAQTDRIDSLLNDLIYNDNDPLIMPTKPVKYNFIYSGINFNSNTFYAGREVGDDMYNISGHVYYYSPTGLFIGTSGSWFDQLTPGYSSTTLSTGFSKAIDNKKLFTFRTSYSRFIYYKPDTSSIYPYKNNFGLGLSFRKKWIGARVSGNLLFGEEYKVNISSGINSRFTLVKFGKFNKIYTAPELSVFLGQETVETKKASQDAQTGTQTATDLTEVYSLLNTQLNLPIGITLGNFDFEFSYSVNFPTTRDVNISYPISSYFSASLGYYFQVFK